MPRTKFQRIGGELAVLVLSGCAAVPGGEQTPTSYRVEGDAIPVSLTGVPGDAARGREVVLARDNNCLLCHIVPAADGRAMGNLAPPLNGVGARLSEGQLRLRMVDSLRLNRNTIMPSYYRTEGLSRVAASWRGKPVLTAQQVEDSVAYLLTLD
jgi:sulfur-oxidizing protein SoxX